MKLVRYSKERRAGDQTSGGRGKLLHATTALDGVDLVVRETLQNSWDARLEDWYPAYGVRVYECSESAKTLLRNQIFTDLPASLRTLKNSLMEFDLHVVEIFDRGTSGLDGPYHATRAPEHGEPNNFNSFVFDIGSTKESLDSGGTYGFGKTAAFEISKAHSLVYWSVCRNKAGELEHRLIASTLHDDYIEAGARFTGAHWWGRYDDDEITPITGAKAQGLGEQLFKTHFGDDETGTSILIIDPVMTIRAEVEGAAQRVRVQSEERARALIEQIGDAIGTSAWPKTVTHDGVYPPMILQLYLNGVEQPTASNIQDMYQPYIHALEKVRHKQQQQEVALPAMSLPIVKEVTIPVTMRPDFSIYSEEEYFGSRTDKTAGHLHLMLCVKNAAKTDLPKNQLCLMRSKAELVVYYDHMDDLEDDSLEWFGVFKPTPECDRHFAISEPPTHDAWSAVSTQNEVSTYVVSKALSTIRRRTRDFLKEYRAQAVKQEYSVRNVALALRDFVPFGTFTPDEPEVKPSRRRGRTGYREPEVRVEILDATALPKGTGQSISIVATSRRHSYVNTSIQVFAATPQGKMLLEDGEFSLEWTINKRLVSSGTNALVPIDTPTEIVLKTRVATALEVDLTAEVKP